jgi:hypothetical protein
MIHFEKIVEEEVLQALNDIRDDYEVNEFYGQLEQSLAEDIVYRSIDFIHDRIREYIEQEALRVAESALDRSVDE